VKCPATFEKIGVCGAVNPRTGGLLSLTFDGFNSDTFIYYLDWLIQVMKTEKKIVLILDNASSHKSHKVLDFIKKGGMRFPMRSMAASHNSKGVASPFYTRAASPVASNLSYSGKRVMRVSPFF